MDRDSPDESQTGINVRVFPALLQDRREVLSLGSTANCHLIQRKISTASSPLSRALRAGGEPPVAGQIGRRIDHLRQSQSRHIWVGRDWIVAPPGRRVFQARVDILHVPYKGGAPAVTDLVGGQTQMIFGPAAAILPLAQAGKLRALAVTSRPSGRRLRPTCRRWPKARPSLGSFW